MNSPLQWITSIEVRFWQFANELLTESSAAQKSFQLVYQAYKRYAPLPLGLKVAFWGLLGLILGIFLGWLGARIIL